MQVLDSRQSQARTAEKSAESVDTKPDLPKDLSSGGFLSSSDRLMKLQLKRRCRDIFGDDFEAKWDCIRSGTLPRKFQIWHQKALKRLKRKQLQKTFCS